MVVLLKGVATTQTLLFVHPKDPAKELWEGVRLGVEAAQATLGFDRVASIEEFDTLLKELLIGCDTLYMAPKEPHRRAIEKAIAHASTSKTHFALIDTIVHIDALMMPLRRTKSAWEIAQIQHALTLTQKAHHAAMAMANPTLYEYNIQALVEYIFTSHGAKSDAYTTIVASGNGANTLHYTANDKALKNGAMILLDAGVAWGNYASDITRTFPVNGKFSSAQRELYTIVLEAQYAALGAIGAGALRTHINTQAVRVLTQGLIDIGVLKSSLDEAIEKELFKPYYPHGIGHFMGLDVHDPMRYKDSTGAELALLIDDVITIEPGLYLPIDDPAVPEAFRGMGVRIEDDIWVQKEGYINMSQAIAKTLDEVEEACQKSVYDYI